MNKIKWLLPLMIIAAAITAVSCGDDENPQGPGDNPTPSTLSADAGLDNSVTGSWTRCPDSDFSQYDLYRSTSAGISQDPPSSPIKTTSSVNDTTFSDTGLDWGEDYYYALRTRNSEGNTAWSNEVHVTVPDSGGCAYLTCYQVQGQQSSSPYAGQTITVTGIVVVGGDEYYSSSGSYAVIMDPDGGPWAGLTLFGNDVAGLSRGDSVIVTGPLQEYNGFTELSYPDTVIIVSSGHSMPDPEPVSTGEAGQEQWESVLLTVSDAIVTEDSLGFGEWAADDGSGEVRIDDLGDYNYYPSVGDTVYTLTGVCWYSFDNFKLEPRDNNDIDVSGGGGGGDAYTCYEIQGQQSSSPYAGQTVSVTGIATSGDAELYGDYAVLEDAGGGPWSGLVIYGTSTSGISRGDSVTVTGVVQEYYGMTELAYPTDIVIHSSGHSLPAAISLTTSQVNDEQYEGVLVSVTDAEVMSSSSYSYEINDGSGSCYMGNRGDYTEPSVGDFLDATGPLFYEYDEWRIQPRDNGDVTIR